MILYFFSSLCTAPETVQGIYRERHLIVDNKQLALQCNFKEWQDRCNIHLFFSFILREVQCVWVSMAIRSSIKNCFHNN